MKEHQLQMAFVEWFRMCYPRALMWATPNEGKHKVQYRVKQRRMGVLAGVPDIFIAEPKENWNGCFIEFKIKPNKPDANQKEILDKLSMRGYRTVVCYTFDEVRKVVEDYLSIKSETIPNT